MRVAMFKVNEEIETIRKIIKKEFDDIFELILKEEKKSKNHVYLINHVLKPIEKRNTKFMNKHKRYFDEKRAYLMRKSNINRPQLLPLDSIEKRYFNDIYEPETRVKREKHIVSRGLIKC